MAESNRGGRARSPNFPAFGLKEAIDKVAKVFEREGKARIAPVSIVKSWEYGSLNGASLRALGALRQYGLLDDVQDDLKVSDLAIKILHGEEQDRVASLRVAAKMPRIFSELLQEYGEDIPSDESIKARLITKMGFNGPEAAVRCVQAFRDTIAFAKLQNSGDINATSEEEAKLNKEKEERGNTVDLTDIFSNAHENRDNFKKPMNPAKEEQGRFIKVWSLTGGTAARLEINSIPSKKDQEFLRLCLERALDELKEIEQRKSSLDDKTI
jgi:hypothetical protein